MSLAEFEQEIVDDLYETLITDDEDKGITLYGDIGSGKSTIALNWPINLWKDGLSSTLRGLILIYRRI